MDRKVWIAVRRRAAPAALVFFALCFGGCVGSPVRTATGTQKPSRRVAVETRASVQAGTVRGTIQVPKGGGVGTTSPNRPTLDELGVHVAYRPVVDVKATWKHHQLHLGGAWTFLHGSARLREPLVTHDDFYAPGTEITSDSGMVEYWLGYRYRFDLLAERGTSLRLSPGLGLYAWGLRYDVTGSNGETGHRHYTDYCPMLDAELEWCPGGPIRVVAEVRTVFEEALGIRSPTTSLEAALRLHADLWKNGGLFAEVGYFRVQHHDHQTVPNDVDVEFAPYVGIGGQVRF